MEFVKLKSRRLLSGLIITLLMLGTVAVAADQMKVVVIPLNSSKSSGGKFVDGADLVDAVYTGGKVGIVEVTSVGQVWMDRNLGALRVGTKSADPDAYGFPCTNGVVPVMGMSIVPAAQWEA